MAAAAAAATPLTEVKVDDDTDAAAEVVLIVPGLCAIALDLEFTVSRHCCASTLFGMKKQSKIRLRGRGNI